MADAALTRVALSQGMQASSGEVAACPPEEALDWEAEEAALQVELAEDLMQLEALEQRLRRLGSEADQEVFGVGTALMLEDLPVERVCLFLPAVGFAALRCCGGQAGRRVEALLRQLLQHRKLAACPGPPLLLPLLHFSHCLQAPAFSIHHPGAGLPRSTGGGIELLPEGTAGEGAAARWCPLRVRSRETSALPRFLFGGVPLGWQTCKFQLRGHVTPRVVQLQFRVEREANWTAGEDGLEFSVSLVDSVAPKQPLFALGLAAPSDAERFFRASVRTVVSCRGASGAWQYKQRSWPLGPAMGSAPQQPDPGDASADEEPAGVGEPAAPRTGLRCCWGQVHVEIDWEAGLCAAVVDGRVEGPFDINGDQRQRTTAGLVDSLQFGGTEPTANEVHVAVSSGISVAFPELLVG